MKTRRLIHIVMKILLIFSLFGFSFLIGPPLSMAENFGEAHGEAEFVSIVSLIANPSSFEGKIVRVIGVMRLEFEGDRLCLDSDSHNYRIVKNCLWISPDWEKLGADREKLVELNGSFVLLEGIFDSKGKGHMGLNSGALRKVSRILEWRSR